MKKSLTPLSLVLIIFNSICLGQSPFNISWSSSNDGPVYMGNKFNGTMGKYLYNFIGNEGGGDGTLMQYDASSLAFIKAIPVLQSSFRVTYCFQKFIILKGKMYTLLTFYDRKTKTTSLFAEEITSDGVVPNSLKKLKDLTSNEKHEPGKINIALSYDSTKFLVADVPPFKTYSGEKIEFTVFDEQLNEVNSTSQPLSLTNNLDFYDFTLNMDGNVYALVKSYKLTGEKYPVYTGRKEHDNDQTDVKWELFSINFQNSGTVNECPITIGDKLITDVSYSVDNDKINITGFYCDGDIYTLTGIFNTILNKTNKQVEKSSMVPYNCKLAAGLSDWELASKVCFISRGLSVRNRVTFNDGSKVLISELSYQGYSDNPHQGPSGWNNNARNYFHSENIIAIFINSDGTIKSITDIPKLQKYSTGQHNSYILFRKGNDDLLFLFNDNANNTAPQYKSLTDLKAMDNPDKSIVVMVDLNKSGSYKREVLFSGDDDTDAPMMANALSVGENDFILPCYHGVSMFSKTSHKLLRISLK